ncbi:hypothetical protein SOVF_066510, partial [Spinacia oleracea]
IQDYCRIRKLGVLGGLDLFHFATNRMPKVL